MTGPESAIVVFGEKVAQAGSLVRAFCPLPSHAYVELFGGALAFSELEIEGIDGYGLAMAMWGSQWGDLELQMLQKERRTLEYEFISMNAPITAGLARIAAVNRPLNFAMSGIADDGTWCGGSYATNGELIKSYEIEVTEPFTDDGLPDWVHRVGEIIHEAVLEKMRRHEQ